MDKKKLITLVCAIFASVLLSISASCAVYEFESGDGVTLYPEEEMQSLTDSLPQEVKDELETFINAESDGERVEALEEKTDLKYWLGLVKELLSEMLIPSIKGGSTLLCAVIVCAVINAVSGLGESSELRGMISLIMSLTTAAVTGKMCLEAMEAASRYISNISSTMIAMTPVMSAVMVTGGSLTQAAVSRSALMLYLTVTENLCDFVVLPLCGALLALGTVSGVFSGIKLSGFISALRRLLMTLISFSTLVFSFVLGIQTALSRSADSLSAKAVRFAVGSYVPIVGGAVSEALSTLSASVGVIRSTAGGVGLVIVLLVLLPTLLTLLLTRLNLILCRSAGQLLDCSEAVGIIGEAEGVLSVLCAMTILSAVFFIFALVLFMGGRA